MNLALVCPSLSDKWNLFSYHIETWLAFVMLAIAVLGIVGMVAGLYRRDENIFRMTSGLLCLTGLGVAGYIFYNAVLLNQPPVCTGGGCGLVDSSEYANPGGLEIFDRPLLHMSTLGLGGYLTILAATFWRGDNGRIAAFGLSFFGFAFSLVLTYIELWHICSICQWCVTSAVVMTMLFVINTCRLICFYGTDDAGSDPETAEETEPD